MSKSDLLLSVNNVSNFYKERSINIFSKGGKKHVLDNVSFEVNKGEIFGIVGESGCGKSTLSKAILNLIAFEGEITIDGISVRDKNKEIRKDIQIVFQDPKSALNPMKRIGWIMEEPLRIHGIGSSDTRKKQVLDMLKLVGLDESFYMRYPHELSGGQQQRVCIGAALMLKPKLLIADEAISALDVSIAAQIINLLNELNRKTGISILFISHDLNVVTYFCDRIAVMNNGRIVEIDDADKIYKNPSQFYTKELFNLMM